MPTGAVAEGGTGPLACPPRAYFESTKAGAAPCTPGSSATPKSFGDEPPYHSRAAEYAIYRDEYVRGHGLAEAAGTPVSLLPTAPSVRV